MPRQSPKPDQVTNAFLRMLFASIDEYSETPVKRFVLSARLGLWPAIAFSAFAFNYLLAFGVFETTLLSIALCLTATLGFLLNDILDQKIDQSNGIHRWSIQTKADIGYIAIAIAAYVVTIAFCQRFLSETAVTLLLVSIALVVAYSIVLKRIFLLGNVVSAVLSMSPGIIMFVDRFKTLQFAESDIIRIAASLIGIGFLFLVSREIRFDEFDKAGDQLGNRITVPMVLQKTALGAMHISLIVSATIWFAILIAMYGTHSTFLNFILALIVTASVVLVVTIAYTSSSKTIFYKMTRITLVILPASIFICF
jgi:4-hydroxybenzoate polyprenyltransferase